MSLNPRLFRNKPRYLGTATTGVPATTTPTTFTPPKTWKPEDWKEFAEEEEKGKKAAGIVPKFKFPSVLDEPEVEVDTVNELSQHIARLLSRFGMHDDEFTLVLGYPQHHKEAVLEVFQQFIETFKLVPQNKQAEYEAFWAKYGYTPPPPEPNDDDLTGRGGAKSKDEVEFYNPEGSGTEWARDMDVSGGKDGKEGDIIKDNLCLVRAILKAVSYLPKNRSIYDAMCELFFPNKRTDDNLHNTEIVDESYITHMFLEFAKGTSGPSGSAKASATEKGLSLECFFELLQHAINGASKYGKSPKPYETKSAQVVVDSLRGNIAIWDESGWNRNPFQSNVLAGILFVKLGGVKHAVAMNPFTSDAQGPLYGVDSKRKVVGVSVEKIVTTGAPDAPGEETYYDADLNQHEISKQISYVEHHYNYSFAPGAMYSFTPARTLSTTKACAPYTPHRSYPEVKSRCDWFNDMATILEHRRRISFINDGLRAIRAKSEETCLGLLYNRYGWKRAASLRRIVKLHDTLKFHEECRRFKAERKQRLAEKNLKHNPPRTSEKYFNKIVPLLSDLDFSVYINNERAIAQTELPFPVEPTPAYTIPLSTVCRQFSEPNEYSFDITNFRGGNVGQKIKGASVGFKRAPPPPGYKYRYVNNADKGCLRHAYNVHKRPEDRLCKHDTGDETMDGMSINDLVATEKLHPEDKFAVWFRGAWARPDGRRIASPNDANILLAAHTEPVQHWDALMRVEDDPLSDETDVYYVKGRSCCADAATAGIMAFRGGAATVGNEDEDPEEERQAGNLLKTRPLFGEPLEYNSRTIDIGGLDDMFTKVGLDAAVHYSSGSPSVDNVVAGLMNKTFERRDTRMKVDATAATAALTFKYKTEFGYLPASIMYDFSNINQASGHTTTRLMLRRREVVESFKSAKAQLGSILHPKTSQEDRERITSQLARDMGQYSDSNIDGWSHVFQRLWSGFLAAASGCATVDQAEIRGNSRYVGGNAMLFARNLDPNVAPPMVRNRRGVVEGTDNDGSCIWPHHSEVAGKIFDPMYVDSNGQMNVMLLSLKHETHVQEPMIHAFDGPADANGVVPFNHWVVLANVTEPHLGFARQAHAGMNQFVARYGDRLPPFKMVTPFERSENVGAGTMQGNANNRRWVEAARNDVYNQHALANPRSWLNAIVYLLKNFGHYRNAAAAFTYAVKRSFSFFSPAVTTLQTPLAVRFTHGKSHEMRVRRRLLVMRARMAGGSNPGDGETRTFMSHCRAANGIEAAPTPVEVPGNNVDREVFDAQPDIAGPQRNWNALVTSAAVSQTVDPGYNIRHYNAADPEIQAYITARFNSVCGAGSYAAVHGMGTLEYDNARVTRHLEADIMWHNKFASCDPGDDASFNKLCSRLTTQEMTHLLGWTKAPFNDTWGTPGHDIDDQLARVERHEDLTITDPAVRRQVTTRWGVNEADAAWLEHSGMWNDVDRTTSLSVTNTITSSTHSLPAGFTQLLLVTDGRYLHSRDEKAAGFANALYRTQPSDILKFALMHAAQMRAAVDVCEMEQTMSSSIIAAFNGEFETGSKELDTFVHETALGRKRIARQPYFQKWMSRVSGALADIYCVHTDVTEMLAAHSETHLQDPIGYSGYDLRVRADPDEDGYIYINKASKQVNEQRRFMQQVSWRVFHPSIMSALIPGTTGVGGQLQRHMKQFNRGTSSSASAIANWNIDGSITPLEVLGAKRVYAAAAGVALHMRMRIKYIREEFEDNADFDTNTAKYAYVWDDILEVAPRASDQVAAGPTHATDILWWYGGHYDPEVVVGRKYYFNKNWSRGVESYDGYVWPGFQGLRYTEAVADFGFTGLWNDNILPALTFTSEQSVSMVFAETHRGFGFSLEDLAGRRNAHHTPAWHYLATVPRQVGPAGARRNVGNFDPMLTHQMAGTLSRAASGSIDGYTLFPKGIIRPGIEQHETRINSHMPLGFEMPEANMPTGPQWDYIKGRLYEAWARRFFDVQLSGLLIWLSDTWSLNDVPELDFRQEVKRASAHQGRNGGMKGAQGGGERNIQVPEVQDDTVFREELVPVRPNALNEGVAAIQGFGADRHRTYDEMAEKQYAKEAEEKAAEAAANSIDNLKAAAAVLEKEKVDRLAQIERITNKYTVALEQFKAAASTSAELTSELQAVKKEIEQLRKEADAKNAELKEKNVELSRLQKQLKDAAAGEKKSEN
uniref:Uncharacterized protein n=2 Tax=Riboviria TaxID=2559587 RepID=A0A8F4X4Z5_9VIRU|nr:hypothetical protein [Rhizoctonia solani dsRNA virus 14]